MWHYYKQATSSGISKKQAEPRWFSVRCGNSHRAHETNKNKKESKSDVNSISCAGFPFKQYRAQIERIDRYMGNAEYKKTLSAVNKLTEELFTLGRLSKK